MKEGLRSCNKSDQIERDDIIPLRCLVPLKKKRKGGSSGRRAGVGLKKEKKEAKLVLSDTDSDNDLIVSACKKSGSKNNGGPSKRKRGSEVECSEETEICVLKLEPDDNELKRSRLDVFEYNEDDLLVDSKKLKKGSEVERKRGIGVYKRKFPKSDMSVEKNMKADVSGEEDFEMEVDTLKEESKVYRKSRVKVKEEYSDSVVVDGKKQMVELSEQTSEHSNGEEDRQSRCVAGSVGSRTRSSVNSKKILDNSGSTEMREKHVSPPSLSTDKNKQRLIRRVKKGTSLTPRLKNVISNSSKKGTRIKRKQASKAELGLSTENPRKRKVNMEKESIREQIKSMVESAGWTIDYRPRKSKDYKDAVYVDHVGSAYWSCLKAYYALKKQCENMEHGEKYFGTNFVFTPISDDLLNKLTRLTKKKIAREKLLNGKAKIENKEGKENAERKAANRKLIKKTKSSSMNGEKLNHHKGKLGKSLKLRLKKNGFNQHRKQSLKRQVSFDDTDEVGNDMHNGMAKRIAKRGSSTYGHDSDKVDNGVPRGKRKGGYSLLVRNSDKEVKSGDNQFIAYPGKLSVLSWLIDFEVLTLGGKVKFMSKKRSHTILEGLITRDGINCGCCNEIFTISEFETHAGGEVHQSCQNLYTENGVSLIQCQIDAWKKQKESEHSGFYRIDVTSDDPNDDSCCICGDGGDLICCDGCPSTFHQSCLDIQVLPKGDWHCYNCLCKFCGLVGCSNSEGDEAATLESLTCSLCEEKYHGSCALQRNAVPTDSDGLSAPFCGQRCRELFQKIQKLLGVKHELEPGFSWTIIQRCNLESDASFCGLPQKVDCNSKLSLALSVMDECFLPTIDERSGINLIHNVVYNSGSNFSRLNYSGFYTFLLERGDEIISAASIRIRGARFAEMPFIGTRHIYRRQGMCRRLLNAIELSLSALNIEKLIIPAISELMDTWTNVFGFIPLEESFRREARYLNMLVFPGVALLQKLLLKHNPAEVIITDDSVLKEIGLEKDNHITAEQTDNSDLVEPDNIDSDVSVVSHANEMTAEAITADACNYSTQVGTICSNGQCDSVELSVEPDLQSTVKDVDGALHVDTQICSNGQCDSVEVSVEPDHQSPVKDVDGALNVDTLMKDVDSSAHDAWEGHASGVPEVSMTINNGGSDPHSIECCNGQSQDDSYKFANGTVTSPPAGQEKVAVTHTLEDGKEPADATYECNLEKGPKMTDLNLLRKTGKESNLSDKAEDHCEVKMVKNFCSTC